MSAGTNLGKRLTTGTDLWIALTEPTPVTGAAKALALLAFCNGTPPTTANTFKHGCLMVQMDTASGSRAVFQNTGSSASPVWSLFDVAGVVPADLITYTSIATAGNASYTAAQMVDAIIDRNGGSADRVDSTDSAANLVAAIPNAQVGSFFLLRIRNISATAGEKITLSAGMGVTLSGNSVVYANGNLALIGYCSNVSPGTQAVTLYGMSNAEALFPATDAASGVNTMKLTTAATTKAPVLGAVGSDTNVGVVVQGQGTGVVTLGQSTSLGTVSYGAYNFIATETGANNAIAGALQDSNGNNIPLIAGLTVTVQLAHTLQAGANTFALNGGAALGIKSHYNTANNIATAYAATGVIDLIYNGTLWLDAGQ